MNTLFDKDDFRNGHNLPDELKEEAVQTGLTIKTALLDTVSTGKVGSLTVDPQYLDFQSLEGRFFHTIIKNKVQ